ncbi:Unknown protein sequence [Pseudomonas amygdali pv. lachrymans]|uniref:Rhs element Vgr protein n=1 Tax=Pseudomonas amygdali pv. lachrymans TaxID=53707 RepID=A0ABR5KTM0_PSEAV|nr:Unknown protein sequence [Pseudomonas amygdali pv. lachrymans]KPC17979.1 Unknown protein sequence [Pseudomonas amygdali pv. lachrymans]RMT05950.1 hypothetical protein ALP54_102744 [Pseudomonas amygdali pv. lachrymans]
MTILPLNMLLKGPHARLSGDQAIYTTGHTITMHEDQHGAIDLR